MERIKALFLIFALLCAIAVAIGAGFAQFSSHGKEIGGWGLIFAACFTLYLFFDELLRGGDGAA